MFQMRERGPIRGQAHVVSRSFSKEFPAAIDRCQTETKELLSVLDTRLKVYGAVSKLRVSELTGIGCACLEW